MSQRKNASLHGSPSPAPEQRSSNSKRNDEYRDVEYVKRDSYGRVSIALSILKQNINLSTCLSLIFFFRGSLLHFLFLIDL